MEKEFESKVRLQAPAQKKGSGNGDGGMERSTSFAFRAPQEQFTIHDFELGKMYGVGSYSKVCSS